VKKLDKQAMRDFLVLGICMGGMSIAFLTFGILARLGYFKGVYVSKGFPVLVPKELVYAMVPFGLMIGLLAILPLIPPIDELRMKIVIYFGPPLWIIGGIFAIWQPRWLKPAWLRWLEDNYGHVREGMFEEARQMGARNWEAQVRTQTDLERWADSVAQKNGWRRRRS
jgi:hypothetical protein